MTSKIKVDNIENQCGGAVVTKCGATTTISGSVVKADDIQAADGGNLINQCGTTITLGASGDTINLAAGASQTGFGRTGTVDWDTTAKTASFTAVSGNGYFVNTTSGAITVTLPATPSAGDIVAVADYAGTAATNLILIARNGSNIEGGTDDARIYENRDAITLVYVDGTQGWVPVNNNEKSGILPAAYVAATGGTITCCGDYKIHTFTGPGTFTVTCAGNVVGSNSVDYMVVAGGGGGGGSNTPGGGGAGGGAGGFRESKATGAPWTASPLATCVSEPVSAQGYPITVGGGGPGAPTSLGAAGSGSNSVFSIYTSAGGGFGGSPGPGLQKTGEPGGSGGGGTYNGTAAGSGNTPPTSPPQGNPGGNGTGDPYYTGGSGGGAGGAGTPASCAAPTGVGGIGGPEIISAISSSPTSYAGGGGGGGGGNPSNPTNGGAGGGGGAGAGGNQPNGAGANASPANKGSGGGGGAGSGCSGGGNGSSGVVIIRYKFQ
jgi:hypothetical protein